MRSKYNKSWRHGISLDLPGDFSDAVVYERKHEAVFPNSCHLKRQDKMDLAFEKSTANMGEGGSISELIFVQKG